MNVKLENVRYKSINSPPKIEKHNEKKVFADGEFKYLVVIVTLVFL